MIDEQKFEEVCIQQFGADPEITFDDMAILSGELHDYILFEIGIYIFYNDAKKHRGIIIFTQSKNGSDQISLGFCYKLINKPRLTIEETYETFMYFEKEAEKMIKKYNLGKKTS